MAKVLILSVSPDNLEDQNWGQGELAKFLSSARSDRFQVHTLVASPAIADIILFAERRDQGPYCEFVRRHPYVKHYREKCFVSDPGDLIIPFLPGIYASIESKYYHEERTRSGSYISSISDDFDQCSPMSGDEKYLYCFVGSIKNAPVRRGLLKTRSERSFFLDTSDLTIKVSTSGTYTERNEFLLAYLQALQESKFVLCPRGVGAGSIRLFETMRSGRVPVIFSDDWVPPKGPDWKKFAIRIKEKDYRKLPAILEQLEPQAIAMGNEARKQWEEWFSEEAYFHRAVEWCLDIQASRIVPERLMGLSAWLQLLRPFHFRNYLRTRYQLYKKFGEIML